MTQKESGARFVLCVRNEGYPASLGLRKVYRVLVDDRRLNGVYCGWSTSRVRPICIRSSISSSLAREFRVRPCGV